jgi:hypothetical protein
MPGPAVWFDDSNDGPATSPRRENCQTILRQAIETCRPEVESWTVMMRTTPDGTLLTFEFSHGNEAPRSFSQEPSIWFERLAGRNPEDRAVDFLQTMFEHRAVDLLQHIDTHLDVVI